MRLDKFISNNTELSRTQITVVIKQGSVKINDVVAKKGNAHINADDVIKLNGNLIEEKKLRYIMLHKPAGYVCANSDSEHPTVLDLIDLPAKHELQIAGRLDIDTTGLVLLTDDGQWNHKITSPKHNHTKSYVVASADAIEENIIEVFAKGLLLHGETKPTLPAELTLIDANHARLDISEGKYHQVKRMFAAVGNRVTALHRDRIGDIALPADLLSGQYRNLTADEVASFGNNHE